MDADVAVRVEPLAALHKGTDLEAAAAHDAAAEQLKIGNFADVNFRQGATPSVVRIRAACRRGG